MQELQFEPQPFDQPLEVLCACALPSLQHAHRACSSSRDTHGCPDMCRASQSNRADKSLCMCGACNPPGPPHSFPHAETLVACDTPGFWTTANSQLVKVISDSSAVSQLDRVVLSGMGSWRVVPVPCKSAAHAALCHGDGLAGSCVALEATARQQPAVAYACMRVGVPCSTPAGTDPTLRPTPDTPCAPCSAWVRHPPAAPAAFAAPCSHGGRGQRA